MIFQVYAFYTPFFIFRSLFEKTKYFAKIVREVKIKPTIKFVIVL